MSSEAENWIKSNKKLIDAMFSDKMWEIFTKKDVVEYFKILIEIYKQARGYYVHEGIIEYIANYLRVLNWKVGYEIPMGDLDSSYRFDLMAQESDKTIIVEVKPEVTTREMGQVIGYMFDVNKKFKKVRTFLGTDICNFNVIFNGEVKDMIIDNARHGLGVFLTNQNKAVYAIPAEFLLI